VPVRAMMLGPFWPESIRALTVTQLIWTATSQLVYNSQNTILPATPRNSGYC